jgi:hypothetical protein
MKQQIRTNPSDLIQYIDRERIQLNSNLLNMNNSNGLKLISCILLPLTLMHISCTHSNKIVFNHEKQVIQAVDGPLIIFSIEQPGKIYHFRLSPNAKLESSFNLKHPDSMYQIASRFPSGLPEKIQYDKNKILIVTNYSIPDATPFGLKLFVDSVGSIIEN